MPLFDLAAILQDQKKKTATLDDNGILLIENGTWRWVQNIYGYTVNKSQLLQEALSSQVTL